MAISYVQGDDTFGFRGLGQYKSRLITNRRSITRYNVNVKAGYESYRLEESRWSRSRFSAVLYVLALVWFNCRPSKDQGGREGSRLKRRLSLLQYLQGSNQRQTCELDSDGG